MIHLLLIAGQGEIAVLPDDVIRYVMHYMLQSFKEKFWLLPENY